MPRCFARFVLPCLAAGPAFFLCAAPAYAALGKPAADILIDSAQMHGAVKSERRQQFEVHVITTDSGMRISEYLNANGIVFAVTWAGPVPPDLRLLLGSHYGDYTAALAAMNHPGLHRTARIEANGLVVDVGGHMRAYSGRAYMPALTPAGVAVGELR
jgi:hypothetical protein